MIFIIDIHPKKNQLVKNDIIYIETSKNAIIGQALTYFTLNHIKNYIYDIQKLVFYGSYSEIWTNRNEY